MRRPLAALLGLLALVTALPLASLAMPFVQPRDASGRFVNLDGTRPNTLWAVLKWAVWDKLTGRRRKSPAHADVPAVAPDLARLAVPPPPGVPARITWLGHAGFLVQLDGVSLLIDPALRPEGIVGVRRNVPAPLTVKDLPPIRAVLVTHGHYDHLDLPTLQDLGAPVIAGLGMERYLRARGLFCTELGWWASAQVGDVTVTFVPAQHWSRRGFFDENTLLWGGFVIQGQAATIYHAGDSALFEGFEQIGKRFPSIDAALLPIGAYDPAWFMEKQHMNPEQALRAFQALGARTFVAMHWGMFKLTDEPLDEPPRRLEAERVRLSLPAERVRVPALGETFEVSHATAAASRAVAAPER